MASLECYGYSNQSRRKKLSGSKASRMSGFQKLIKPTPDYTMYYRKGRAVPRQRKPDGFLSRGIIRWKPHAHNLFLNLRNLPVKITKFGNLSRTSERACSSLNTASLSIMENSSSLKRESMTSCRTTTGRPNL